MNVRLSNSHGTIEISDTERETVAAFLGVLLRKVLQCDLVEAEAEALRTGRMPKAKADVREEKKELVGSLSSGPIR